MLANLARYGNAVKEAAFVRRVGRVVDCHGLVIEANGPTAYVGETCEITPQFGDTPVYAEVVGLKGGRVLLMPFGDLNGVGAGSIVVANGSSSTVPVDNALLGRVIDAFGRPIDGKGAINATKRYPIRPKPLNPLSRAPITVPVETGVKAIDVLLRLGRGQRVGIFSGSGVGKSTLLGMITRNVDCDLAVIALIGERGREIPEFVAHTLGEKGLKRAIVVAATSDEPALVRTRAAFTATAIAEYFRDQGKNVLFVMDSVTRFAMAQREIGLSIGEPPTARGYTPSVFSLLPKLLERCGAAENGGSITALYSVLMEGDDIHDVMADTMRSILDGHIVLSRELANQGRYPAIDVLGSLSRLMPNLIGADEKAVVQKAIAVLSTYQRHRDLLELGAYKSGSNAELDKAVQLMPRINAFLKQNVDDVCRRDAAFAELKKLLG
jgi:flagellum-specific ATP synthase